MTLSEVYKKFPTSESCIKHLEKVRWNGTPVCPYCRQSRVTIVKGGDRYHCNACNASFCVTVSTLFHKTHIDLQKWFFAISIILKFPDGVSVRELASKVDVNRNTAHRMIKSVYKALASQRKFIFHITGTQDLVGLTKLQE